ncbi:MAG: TolC family protein [Bacteroidales bacterium]
MNKLSYSFLIILLIFSGRVNASEPQVRGSYSLINSYREKALEYNHDLKIAEKNIAASDEVLRMAKNEYLPKLSGSASYKYVGNPTQLDLQLPTMDAPLSVGGNNHNQYGAFLNLMQPVYQGGAIKASVQKSMSEKEYSIYQKESLQLNVLYVSDYKYWSTVANEEVVRVSEQLKASIEQLVLIVKQRVDAGAVSKNDLLMVEVKLNEATYQLMQLQTQLAVNKMSLNSFIGSPLNDSLTTDSSIPVLSETELQGVRPKDDRPEIRMAETGIDIQKATGKLRDSKYLPQINVGAEGSYSSPGYNFDKDLDPNYAFYAKISMPLYQWGKRSKEKRISNYQIEIAQENKRKIEEQIQLETQSAILSLQQAQKQVDLTGNSLEKAFQNEKMLMERYAEGEISVLEVLDGQVYRQTAQMNYVQAKLNAQMKYSEVLKTVNAYPF